MELFSLLAKLTLDSKEYDKGLQEAENKAQGFELEDPKLGLDDHEFEQKIAEAEDAEVDDPESPELGLDDSPFQGAVEDAEETEVEDPEEPSLGLDTSEFSENIGEAESLGTSFGSTIKGVFEEIKGALAVSGIVAAVAGVVSSLKEGVELAKNHGDQIHKQSAFLGLTTKAYQELDYALTLSGASITDMTRSMRSFQQMAGGDITKDQADAFEKLGIKAEAATDAQDLMYKSLYALADYSKNDRDIIAKALFGNNYTKLTRLLEGGSEGIRQMQEEAEGLGLVMTDEEIQNAADYMDATTRLEKSLSGIKEAFAGSILPLLTEATNAVAQIIAFFNPRTSETSLSDMFKETDKEMSKDLVTIEGTSGAALDLIDKLFSMGDATKLTAEQQEEWKSTAQWLIDNIPSLSDKIDLDTMSINANKDAINADVEAWKKMATEKAIANAKDAKYQAMLEENADAIDKRAKARAKENEIVKKENERIAEANNLLKNNDSLAESFGAIFGTTTIDKNADNLDQMMDWLEETGNLFADTRGFNDLTNDLYNLRNEQSNLTSEAKAADEQLQKAQTEYQAWCEAIDELYGIEATDAAAATESANGLKAAIDQIPNEKRITILQEYEDAHSHAIGSAYIPYDNYPALLHRGERILTATEARQDSGSVDISAMEDRIVAAIRSGMENATVRSYLNGQDITDEVNRNNTRTLKARRFNA